MRQNNLREVWNELRGQPSRSASDIRLQFVSGIEGVRIFAALTARSLPALLVELPVSAQPQTFKRLVTRAFEMSAPDVTGLGEDKWAVVIELKDSAFADLFEALASDIVQAIGPRSSSAEALRALMQCVGRWRRFLERRREPLSEEEVRGLIGEIVVLCRCAQFLGPELALEAWTGPERGLKDFELPDKSVEVKTFEGSDAATVMIAQPNQLDAVAERPLFLCAVRLTPLDVEGTTLGEFAARAAEIVGTVTTPSGGLEDRLAAAGYLSAHSPLYSKRFAAGPVWSYAVTPEFPRIRSVDVPTGVVSVRFSLTLAAIARFKADPIPIVGGRVAEIEAVE